MRNVKFFWTTLFMAMGFVFSAYGQDMAPKVNPKPILIFNPGESIIFKIDENREAAVAVSHSQPFFIKVKVDLAETLCAEQYRTPRCSYGLDYASDYVALIWTKHPDASKLGQVVKSGYGGPTTMREIKTLVGSTFANRFLGSRPEDRFRPDQFFCDNYEWLGQKSDQLNIQLWSGERMLPNPETGVNENRTDQMVENINFTIDANNTYQLTKLGRVSSTFPIASLILLDGNSSTLQVFNSSQTETCQASLSYNVQSAIAGIDLDAHFKEKANFEMIKGTNSQSLQLLKSSFSSILAPTDADAIPEFQ